jgi:hypothetical protein
MDSSPRVFRSPKLYEFIISPTRATWPASTILTDLTALTKSGVCKLWSFFLWIFLCPRASSLIGKTSLDTKEFLNVSIKVIWQINWDGPIILNSSSSRFWHQRNFQEPLNKTYYTSWQCQTACRITAGGHIERWFRTRFRVYAHGMLT